MITELGCISCIWGCGWLSCLAMCPFFFWLFFFRKELAACVVHEPEIRPFPQTEDTIFQTTNWPTSNCSKVVGFFFFYICGFHPRRQRRVDYYKVMTTSIGPAVTQCCHLCYRQPLLSVTSRKLF